MNNWWKSPVLQGPENDYGDYDYLIEEFPKEIALSDEDYNECFDKFVRLIAKNGNRY